MHTLIILTKRSSEQRNSCPQRTKLSEERTDKQTNKHTHRKMDQLKSQSRDLKFI